MDATMRSVDFLDFKDSKKYKETHSGCPEKMW